MNGRITDAMGKAEMDISRLESMMYATDEAYISIPDEAVDHVLLNRRAAMFYAAWDMVNRLKNDLDGIRKAVKEG